MKSISMEKKWYELIEARNTFNRETSQLNANKLI